MVFFGFITLFPAFKTAFRATRRRLRGGMLEVEGDGDCEGDGDDNAAEDSGGSTSSTDGAEDVLGGRGCLPAAY